MASGTELAKAYVQIIPSAQGIKGKITEELGGESESAGQSAGSKIASSIKRVIVAAELGKALGQALNSGAELQQNLGGTEAVFGNFASSIQQSATTAYKNMGLSASDYMATANKMGSLFQGSGIDQQTSLNLTSKAMQRAADVASVMGVDMSMAMESIAGAAKGNFTMMDNLGVSMNATTLQAYALEKGINFNWNTASNAEKAELAMQMFFERTEQYAGNFANESERTLSGSMDAVKAAFQNVLGNLTLGNDIGPSLQALSETVVTFVSGNLIPALQNIFMALPSALVTLVTSIGPALIAAAFELVQNLGSGIIAAAPALYESAMLAIQNFQQGITGNYPAILQNGIDTISNLASGFLQNMPTVISAIGNILAGVLSALLAALPQLLSSGVQLIGRLASGMLNNLPAILSAIANVIARLLARIGQSLPQLLQKGIELIGKLAAGIIQSIPTAVAAIPSVISGITGAFNAFDWKSIGSNIISGLANGIRNGVGSIINAAKEAAKSAFNAAKSALEVNSPSRKFRWLGEQSDEGLAEGLSGNTGVIANAMKYVTDMVTDSYSPKIDAGVLLGYETGASVTRSTQYGNTASMNDKFDQMIALLEVLTKQETKVVVNGRDAGRILREMGVSFA